MYYVYILTNDWNTVLYVGVTNNLTRRYLEHDMQVNKGFTYRYNIHKLVYFECFEKITDAIVREKKVKKLSRTNKEKLINRENPEWKEIADFG